MISFKANLVNKTNIQQRTGNGKYKKCPASFVELNPSSKKDQEVLKTICNKWQGNGVLFTKDILRNFQSRPPYYDCLEKKEELQKLKIFTKSFYAITTQKHDFLHLDAEDILGLAQTDEGLNNEAYIDYVQVHPQIIYKQKEREFKNVGSMLVKELKQIFKNKDISLFAMEKEIQFYKQLGFEMLNENNKKMIFKH